MTADEGAGAWTAGVLAAIALLETEAKELRAVGNETGQKMMDSGDPDRLTYVAIMRMKASGIVKCADLLRTKLLHQPSNLCYPAAQETAE